MKLEAIDRIDSRICYKGGIVKEENKLIELHRNCYCNKCVSRYEWRQGIRNCATVTVENIDKLEEAKNFLKNWTCGKEREDIKVQYFRY